MNKSKNIFQIEINSFKKQIKNSKTLYLIKNLAYIESNIQAMEFDSLKYSAEIQDYFLKNRKIHELICVEYDKLWMQNNNDYIWASRTTEFNTLQNNLLENLLIVNYALEKIECNLYNKIITDIDLVAYGISEQLKNKNISHKKINFKSVQRIKIRFWLKNIKIIFYNWYFYFIAKRKIKPKFFVNNTVILHTFPDKNSLNSQKYTERYFPFLSEYLESNNKNIKYWFSECNLNNLPLMKHLNTENLLFNQYQYLRVTDYLYASYQFMKLAKLIPRLFRLQDQNYSKFFRISHFQEGIDQGSFEAILVYLLIRRLKDSLPNDSQFILEFEGMIFERMFYLSKIKYFNEMKTIGYQHGALLRDLFCIRLTPGLRKIAVPNRIICTGKKYSEFLHSIGFNSKIIEIGPALRYQYLYEKQNLNKKISKKILVILPFDKEISDYIIRNIRQVFKNSSYSIKYKFHPMSEAKDLNNDWLLKQDIEVRNLSQCMFEYSYIFGSKSSSCLEAILAQKQVIEFIHPFRFNFSPLFLDSKAIRYVKIINSQLIQILEEDSNISNMNLKREYFTSINKINLGKFLL